MILIFHSIPRASEPREKYAIGSEPSDQAHIAYHFKKIIILSFMYLYQQTCVLSKVEVSIRNNYF